MEQEEEGRSRAASSRMSDEDDIPMGVGRQGSQGTGRDGGRLATSKMKEAVVSHQTANTTRLHGSRNLTHTCHDVF